MEWLALLPMLAQANKGPQSMGGQLDQTGGMGKDQKYPTIGGIKSYDPLTQSGKTQGLISPESNPWMF